MEEPNIRLKDLLTRPTFKENKQALSAEYVRIFKKLWANFREEDGKNYALIKNYSSHKYDDVKVDLKARIEGLSETVLLTYFNCCSFGDIREEFGRFIMEFDDNFDGKLQVEELVRCLELLGKDEYIGKHKMRMGLMAMGIEVDVGVSMLKEGADKRKLIDVQIVGQLADLFVVKIESGTVNGQPPRMKKLNYIEMNSLLPYLLAYWLEYQVKVILNRQVSYVEIRGLPLVYFLDGSVEYDPEGEPSGLFLALTSQLGRRPDLNEECISYHHVIRALETFRSLGFKVDFDYEAGEKVMLEVKALMKVDICSSVQSKLFSIQEILPKLTMWVCQQIICSKLKKKFHSRMPASAMRFEMMRQNMHIVWENLKSTNLTATLKTAFQNKENLMLSDASDAMSSALNLAIPGLLTDMSAEVCRRALEKARVKASDPEIVSIETSYYIDEENFREGAAEYNDKVLELFMRYMLEPKKFPKELHPRKTVFEVKKAQSNHVGALIRRYSASISEAIEEEQDVMQAKFFLISKLTNLVHRNTDNRPFTERVERSPPKKPALKEKAYTDRRTSKRVSFVSAEPRKTKDLEPEEQNCTYMRDDYIKNLFDNSKVSDDRRTRSVYSRVKSERHLTHENFSKIQTLVTISENPKSTLTPAGIKVKQLIDNPRITHSLPERRRSRMKFMPSKQLLLEDSDDDEEIFKKAEVRGKCCTTCTVF
mmetsp:Transcript_32737/g.56988  ORF Transcript_32737/g.56988 Transcript_32737/m.56988 type:complete len:708 (-) Transcript_32737:743-2866(-)